VGDVRDVEQAEGHGKANAHRGIEAADEDAEEDRFGEKID
jgi:hypothetical protein